VTTVVVVRFGVEDGGGRWWMWPVVVEMNGWLDM